MMIMRSSNILSTTCRYAINRIVTPSISSNTSSMSFSTLSYNNNNNTNSFNSIYFNNNNNTFNRYSNLIRSQEPVNNIDINEDNHEIYDDEDSEITIAPSPLEIDPLIASLSAPSMQPYRLSTSDILDQASTSMIIDSVVAEEDGIECVKRTYQPSVLIRKRRHGFLHRLSTKQGKRVLNSRVQKGRKSLSA